MKPRSMSDLAEMVFSSQLKLLPSYRSDGMVIWDLVSYRTHNGGTWPGYSIEMGRKMTWR